MKKNIKRAAAEDKRYTADKVSLRECLGIFKNIRLPWGLMTAGVIFALLAAYATLQVSSFSGSACCPTWTHGSPCWRWSTRAPTLER